MKAIVLSVIMFAIAIVLIFGVLAFVEWNINPCFWDVGTRVVGSFLFAAVSMFWITFMINYLINRNYGN